MIIASSILAGAGTALCMLLKSLPHLLVLTPAARVLQLLICEQREETLSTKPRAASFNRVGLLDLLEQQVLSAVNNHYGQPLDTLHSTVKFLLCSATVPENELSQQYLLPLTQYILLPMHVRC